MVISFTPNAPLILSCEAIPLKPLFRSAKGWSCQAWAFSMSVQEGQAVVKPILVAPDLTQALAAFSISS
jgi:hypothetical protein